MTSTESLGPSAVVLLDRLSEHPEDAEALLLSELKQLGRKRETGSPIYSEQGISTLIYYAFEKGWSQLDALRCLANALLLSPSSKKIFGDKGGYVCVLKSYNEDLALEFLLSRICFLGTVDKDCLSVYDWTSEFVASTIYSVIERHLHLEMEGDALSSLNETLKFLFNVTLLDVRGYDSVVPLLLSLVERAPRKLAAPATLIINVLLNLPVTAVYFNTADACHYVKILISILEDVKEDGDKGDELAPLFGVLRKIFQACPENVLQYGKDTLLPDISDRKRVLGTGKSTADYILKLSVCVHENLKNQVGFVLFELSDCDSVKFVDNIGFGYACGFLMAQNIPFPLDEGDSEYNQITGQLLSEEKRRDIKEMSDEEKEREAERLFVLFERMRKSGVIRAENPVRVAQSKGELN